MRILGTPQSVDQLQGAGEFPVERRGQGRSRGIRRKLGDPERADDGREVLLVIGGDLRQHRQAAEAAFLLQGALAKGVDRRDREQVQFEQGAVEPGLRCFVGEQGTQGGDMRVPRGFVAGRRSGETGEHAADAFRELAGGVIRERHEEQLGKVGQHSLQQEARHQMADGVGFTRAGTGFNDGQSGLEGRFEQGEFGK